MNEGEYRRAQLRLALERLICEDRLAHGRDVSHLAFGRGPAAAEIAMHAILAHIRRVTAALSG